MSCSFKQSFYCTAKLLYMFQAPFAPIIRSTKKIEVHTVVSLMIQVRGEWFLICQRNKDVL